MSNKLLTKVISKLVGRHERANEYGVALVNIPDFDYSEFVSGLSFDKKIHIFFLGFSKESETILKETLPAIRAVKYSFSVEEAEKSRNSGDENVFRILIIKRAEIEKISSLRWFPEIALEKLYVESCNYVAQQLQNSNSTIDNLIQVLKYKQISSILSFGRVLDYLTLLLNTETQALPNAVVNNYYKLGLLADKNIVSKNPDKKELAKRIKFNHSILERISNLEQTERISITNYYAQNPENGSTPGLILKYYKEKEIEVLGRMELEDVVKCLKNANARPTPGPRSSTPIVNPTAIGAQLIFEGEKEKIQGVLDTIKDEVDGRNNPNRSERISIDVDGVKVNIKVEPVTEKVANELTSEEFMGGIIHADVDSPNEAIKDIEKYEYFRFTKEYVNDVINDLKRIGSLLTDKEHISECLEKYIFARDKVSKYCLRLQDVPMLQVLEQYSEFEAFIRAYERLLVSINDDFPKIWNVAASNAKGIVNALMSLDYIFVVSDNKRHAIPTPLHPLYLWKYIELAKEILAGRGVSNIEDNCLSDDDKAFIIRKSEDIPDPLSIMLMPASEATRDAVFLPLAGRIGTVPIYSNVPQINQSESGLDTLKQTIIRYLCLYPHAAMMLRISIVDPPSVESIVNMLKVLNADKEFNITGIDLTIYRSKEVPESWIEIEDSSLNEGMLGKYKGKKSFQFKVKIINKRYSYSKILSELANEQHLCVIFDPNEVRIDRAQNDKHIHIHPLCIPKVYKYNPIEEDVEIRPANEGGIFTVYTSILEKLKENPSIFNHTSTYFKTPLKRETYDKFLEKSDWLVILDQSLKSWDISLRAVSEKLFYRENDYRSIGVYSSNCKKFILGYDALVKKLGNFIPLEDGLKNVIESVRNINNDGLLSIVSHTSNMIFDEKHGKGSLGTAIAAIHYKNIIPNSIIVGLDTQLAQEWLSDRDEGELPDLVAIELREDNTADINIVEVKTYANSQNSFVIENSTISGHAVQQVSVLENLIYEMFGASERITTVSRREILREQVFECLFHSNINPGDKLKICNCLNLLFAGNYQISIKKNIAYIDFENEESSLKEYSGKEEYEGKEYCLTTIGSKEIQDILSGRVSLDGGVYELSSAIDNNIDNVGAEQADVADNSNTSAIDADDFEDEVQVVNLVNENIEETRELDAEENSNVNYDESEEVEQIREKCAKLNKVLKDYGIRADAIDPSTVQEAARFTRFPVKLKSGETINSLNRYKNDIGIQLEANGEILIEHIRGTSFVSVDIPFAKSTKAIKVMENLPNLDNSIGNLNILAGQSADGNIELIDVSKAVHMLVAGTTGSGKTIFLQSILVSLLYQYNENDLEVLIIDPKQTDFIFYEGLKQLYGGKVIIEADEALEVLEHINSVEKVERTNALRSCRSRDIDSYNEKNPDNKMKRLVVIIDEYADLIQAAELNGNRKEFEKNLLMLLQRVRNLGIHLIIATQRPSAQIVTGALKAVIPFRVSFRLPSHTDSQTILDKPGAENLLGQGDMLVVSESDTKRLQGLFISEQELERFLANRMGE